jgi:hypothetical protein
MAKPKLGEILKARKLLSDIQLKTVLAHQKQWGVSFGRAAISAGFCNPDQILEALSQQLAIPTVPLDQTEMNPALAELIPQKIAEQHQVVPLKLEGPRGEVMVVAMAAPASFPAQDAVLAVSRKQRLKVLLAHDEAVQRAIGRLYRGDRLPEHVGEVTLDAREQMLELSSEGDLTDAPRDGGTRSLLDQLTLSDSCREVIHRAAKAHNLDTGKVIEKVLEVWAAKQQAPR